MTILRPGVVLSVGEGLQLAGIWTVDTLPVAQQGGLRLCLFASWALLNIGPRGGITLLAAVDCDDKPRRPRRGGHSAGRPSRLGYERSEVGRDSVSHHTLINRWTDGGEPGYLRISPVRSIRDGDPYSPWGKHSVGRAG